MRAGGSTRRAVRAALTLAALGAPAGCGSDLVCGAGTVRDGDLCVLAEDSAPEAPEAPEVPYPCADPWEGGRDRPISSGEIVAFQGSALGVGDADGDGVDDLLPVDLYSRLYALPGPVCEGDSYGYPEYLVDGYDFHRHYLLGEAWGADADGDGVEDILVNSGAGFAVFHGPLAGQRTWQEWDAVRGGYANPAPFFSDLDADGAAEVVLATEDYEPPSTYGWGALAYPLDGPRVQGDRWADVAVWGRLGKDDWWPDAAVVAVDLDGDGADDLVVGTPAADGGGEEAGAVLAFQGPLSGDLTDADADSVLATGVAGDFLGWALEAGDLDGDGTGEVVADARGLAEPVVPETGRVLYVLSGALPASGSPSDLAVATLVGALDLPENVEPGPSIACADLDGDGDDDLAIGSPYDDAAGEAAGGVSIVLDMPSGTVSLPDDADARLYGKSGSYTGWWVRHGDLDGVGPADLAVTARLPVDGEEGSRLSVLYGGWL